MLRQSTKPKKLTLKQKLQMELKTLKDEMKALESRNTELKQDTDTLMEKSSLLERKLSQLEIALASSKKREHALKIANNSLATTIKELKTTISQLDAAIEFGSDVIAEGKDEYIQKLEQETKALKELNNTHEIRIKTLVTELTEYNRQLALIRIDRAKETEALEIQRIREREELQFQRAERETLKFQHARERDELQNQIALLSDEVANFRAYFAGCHTPWSFPDYRFPPSMSSGYTVMPTLTTTTPHPPICGDATSSYNPFCPPSAHPHAREPSSLIYDPSNPTFFNHTRRPSHGSTPATEIRPAKPTSP